MLGRQLIDGEVVHHIDEDRANNSHDNLMVFKTSSDHARYHKTHEAILMENGSYISPELEFSKVCISCKNEFITKNKKVKYCSPDCFNKSNRRVERPEKHILESQIKELGFVGTGRLYGVSDNAIRKWLKNYK